MELESKNRIIAWDNENSETKYFVNGTYVGSAYDFIELIEKAFAHMTIGKDTVTRKIYGQDLDYIPSIATADKIAMFLDVTEKLTLNQEEALYNYDFQKLEKTIK